MTLFCRTRRRLVFPIPFPLSEVIPHHLHTPSPPKPTSEARRSASSSSAARGMSARPSPKRRKLSPTPPAKMTPTIELTPIEKTLRLLLLDVAEHVTSKAHQHEESTSSKAGPLELRFTGGWVRDKLLGVNSQDIDVGISTMTGYQFGLAMQDYLKTPKNVDKYKKLHADDKDFQNKIGGLHKIEANPEKSKHLETVTTKIFGLDIDLVNLRKETYSEESRNPQMEFGTPEEDALRRDATVNALFYNLHTNEVEDFTQCGLDDMAIKLIRTPLEPHRTFTDDPLRVLRLIRFASRLNYDIDIDAEKAMGDPEIKKALNVKISRERVGKEIEKMLKGPDPCAALEFIDRLGLFQTVFSSPEVKQIEPSTNLNWKAAYEGLNSMVTGLGPRRVGVCKELTSTLIRSDEDLYHSWYLAAFVPWAHTSQDREGTEGSKEDVDLAVKMARESIKADNKISGLLDGAVKNWKDIIVKRDRLIDMPTLELEHQGLDYKARAELGMAVRQWGRNWRLHTIFAILAELASKSKQLDDAAPDFSKWITFISRLKELDVLEAYSTRPIVNGTEIRTALGSPKAGPWIMKAVEMVVEWQLCNPEGIKEDALEAVVNRKAEYGL